MKINYMEPTHKFNVIPDPHDADGILKFIESIGRVCYKSEDRITEDSAKKFVKMIFDRGHTSVFEHYIFTFEVTKDIYMELLYEFIDTREYNKYRELLSYFRMSKYDNKYFISGSIRAFNQMADYLFMYSNEFKAFMSMYQVLQEMFPCITYESWRYTGDQEVRLVTLDEINSFPEEIRRIHNWFSVYFTADRSITHQIVRHKKFVGVSQESTRYVNYGNKGYSVILPYWMPKEIKELVINNNNDTEAWKEQDSDMVIATKAWIVAIKDILLKYDWFINLNNPHFTPQDLKGIIIDSIKAEINITTFEDEWLYIFNMRCTSAAYPGMRELMIPTFQDFYNIGTDKFMDQMDEFTTLKDIILNDGGKKYFETDTTTVPIYYASTTN